MRSFLERQQTQVVGPYNKWELAVVLIAILVVLLFVCIGYPLTGYPG